MINVNLSRCDHIWVRENAENKNGPMRAREDTQGDTESTPWTPVMMSSEVTAAETHLAPYWEGMGWELLEGYQLHCLHCSPCRHYHHCCHCTERDRVTELEKESSWWSLEDVWGKLNYTTALDILALFYHMSSCHNNILVTVATDSQLCECAVCRVWHIHTWILGTDLWAHSHICSYTV